MTSSTKWTGAAGDYAWYDVSNWKHGVPVAGEDAIFDAGASGIIRLEPKPGGAPDVCGALEVSDCDITFYGGELDFEPTDSQSGLTFDFLLNDGATFTLAAGAKLVGDETLELGETGAPSLLTVYGTVSEQYALIEGGEVMIAATGHWVSNTSGFAVGGDDATLLVTSGGRVDGGPGGLKNIDRLDIGVPAGKGAVDVVGAGSSITLTYVDVGEYYSDGTMMISGGGGVTDEVGEIAFESADGYVTVTGQGSRWDNLSALGFGQAVPTNSDLTVTDHGEVDWGRSGFELNDNLNIDGSAILKGKFILDGGQIVALGGKGDATLTSTIYINANWLYQYHYLAYFASKGGVSLTLAGAVYKDDFDIPSTLEVGVGHVILSNAKNNFGSSEIYAATLEAATTGALGAGDVDFISHKHAELEIDSGVSWDNIVSHFKPMDEIDLRGFAYDDAIQQLWVPSARGASGGALVVGTGAAHQVVYFGDNFAQGDFQFAQDAAGGTIIRLASAQPA